MTKNHVPEIDIDELMEKIRAEVNRYTHDKEQPDQHVPGSSLASEKAHLPKFSHLNLDLLSKPQPLKIRENGYHINDFLKHHDSDFVTSSYRGILRRQPDFQGLHYFLKCLRSGEMTKAEILGRLRYSAEGRHKGIRVKGLLLPFLVHSSFRIPFLGYFIRLITGIVQLPALIRNFQHLDYQFHVQLQYLKEHVNQTASAVVEQMEKRKANRSDLHALSDQKADKTELESVSRQIMGHRRNILDQDRRLRLFLEEARKRLPEPISTPEIKTMVSEEAHLLDAMYVSFEDQFRGTREDIKARQTIYLPYLKKADAGTREHPLIDVGCGRGEWLELLKENGFVAKGIDINNVFAFECRDRGMKVTIGDAIEVLRKEKAFSHGAITAFHLVEHLPVRAMIALFDESFRVLKPGGVIIFETPNPDNILVGCRNFYIDPTHRNPIPSSTLRFIAEARGFENTQILNLHPVHDSDRDKGVGEPLSKLLYGPQDYAIIGCKV